MITRIYPSGLIIFENFVIDYYGEVSSRNQWIFFVGKNHINYGSNRINGIS